MKRYSSLLMTLLLVSSLLLFSYGSPPTRIEIDSTEPRSLMFRADTTDLAITTESGLTYGLQIYDEQGNYTNLVFQITNAQGDFSYNLKKAGFYYLVFNSSSIGFIEIETVGIPTGYLIYMSLLLLAVLYSTREQILQYFTV